MQELDPELKSDTHVRIPLSIRLLWLIVPCTILLASFLLRTGSEREVVLPGIQVKLPELCTMYSQLGLDCPGCGLTRSFVHMSAGRIGEAWRLNPVGILGYIYVVIQIPIAAVQFLPATWQQRLFRPSWLANWDWFNQWLFIALMIALPIQWMIRLLWRGFT